MSALVGQAAVGQPIDWLLPVHSAAPTWFVASDASASFRTTTACCGRRLSSSSRRSQCRQGCDIGRPEVVAGLRGIAPVSTIRGNVDIGEWAEHYPDTRTMK